MIECYQKNICFSISYLNSYYTSSEAGQRIEEMQSGERINLDRVTAARP